MAADRIIHIKLRGKSISFFLFTDIIGCQTWLLNVRFWSEADVQTL